MIKKTKNLYLFTQKFPYCDGKNCKGDPYLVNELPVLERDFDKIYLIPRLRGDNIREIPDNAEILSIDYYDINMNGNRGKFQKILDVTSLARRNGSLKLLWVLLQESFFHVEDKFSIADNLKIISRYFLYSLFIIDKLKINENDTNIFYSYWFNEWTLILSLLVDFGVIEKYVTRAHAKSDLYIDKFTDTILHRYRAGKANRIYPVSLFGKDYLSQRYPKMTDKIEVGYLGTTDWGVSQFPPDNAKFTIVSCSNANKIKRLHLIIEALKLTEFDVRWIHFGEGELLASLKEMAKSLPPNVTHVFAGQVRYQELMEYYRDNSINLFINTSSYEGLPVSAVEAASFGIPLMATDVYGTSEIVNENTGILLDANPSPEDIADKILSFKKSEMNSKEFRIKVRNYWSDKFNAQRVYDDFSTTLINEFTSVQKVRRMEPV